MTYKSLCAEFYDLTKPTPGPLEWAFYDKLLKTTAGITLEAMCGSGRLLVRLLEKGYFIEGVDSSFDMLQRCREKCLARALPVTLYQQSLQELSLPNKYSLIFISIGSFQHIRDLDEALNILGKLRSHLAPNGTLVLETFAKENLSLESLDKPLALKWATVSPDGDEIVNKSIAKTIGPDLLFNQMKYEKWRKGELIEVEMAEWYIKVYDEESMRSHLRQSGFSNVTISCQSFEFNPRAILYFAS